LKPTKAVPALPEVVLETPENRLWYKFDDKFEVPKINMKFDFVAGVAVAFGDPRDAVCNRLYVDLVTDALNEYAYAADIAGLSFQLSNTKYGLELEISGYCSKEGVLLEAIMSKMLEPAHLKPERFVILKEKYKRSLENFKGKQPCDHTSHYVNLVTSGKFHDQGDAK
jgi:insulysin